LAAVERPAFGEQFRSCGAMNCAIDPAAAQERRVGGVDDGVKRKLGDVALDNVESRGFDRCGEKRRCHRLNLSQGVLDRTPRPAFADAVETGGTAGALREDLMAARWAGMSLALAAL